MVFLYDQQVPVLFGAGAIDLLGEKIAEMGCKKVLCVYDGGVKAAGINQKAETSLKKAGLAFVIFDRVSPEPPTSLIDEGGVFAKANDIDCVVGIGGGSSMDAAKAVALLLCHEPPISQYLTLPPMMLEASVPIVLVPTTSGTGSEATQVSVLSNEEQNAKMALFVKSDLAIVDPELSHTVPPQVTASTGLDALSHAVEAITAKKRNPRSELLAQAAIQKIAKYLPIAYKDGNNKEAREQLSLASNWAGIAFADTDVHFGHSVADGISAEFHTPHGINCAWATPATIELVAPVVPEKVKIIGAAMGAAYDGSEDPAALGKKAADAVRELMKAVDIQSMAEMGFSREAALNAADGAMESGLRFNCPVEVTPEIAGQVMGNIFDNYR